MLYAAYDRVGTLAYARAAPHDWRSRALAGVASVVSADAAARKYLMAMVAKGRFELPTRGFSVRGRGGGGARKPKTGNGFLGD